MTSTIDGLPFEQVWLADFEFIPKPGEHPDVVCLCARELRSRQTLRLWRTELGTQPPYRIDDKVLFVCFAATAECTCHLALDWPMPQKIFDLSPVFRCIVNGRETPHGKGLIGALAYFGLDSIGAKYKDDMRKRIIQGWPFTWEEREKILNYCLSDTEHLEGLLAKLLPQVELATALHWGEFAAASAAEEQRGVPLDPEITPQLLDPHVWAFARDALIPKIDAHYGVYLKGADSGWHFNGAKFEECCARLGIDWPRKEESGKLDLRKKTWESMCKSFPVLEPLRQLKHTRDKMRKIKLAVGADMRNRTVLWPFQSKTSRTQPKAAQWIFSPAVWLRSLIKPGPGRAIAYIDWSSMEFQVAAVLSKCGPMIDLYDTGSPYIEFAKRFDEAPPDATKKTSEGEQIHERYKVGLLGAQYQMQFLTLAQRLGVSTFVAHEMLSQHHGLFRQFWAWNEDWIAHALDTGLMHTPLGWSMHTGITEFNERSIGNFVVQATSADILRLSCVWMHRRGIELCGSVHDAVLIEAPIDRIEADVALAEEIMRRAARVVLNTDDNGTSSAPRQPSCPTLIATATNAAAKYGRTCSTSWSNIGSYSKRKMWAYMPNRTKGSDRFVKVPLWWAEQASQATRTPKAMVWIWLLHLSWAAHSNTFRLPNERLRVRGVSRGVKTRALQELEKAGLVRVTREKGKSPTVILLYS